MTLAGRHRSSLAARTGVLAVVVFGAASVTASRWPPARWELAVFRWANDLPSWPRVPLWRFMQFGSLGAIPVAAVTAWLLRCRRTAIAIAVAGSGGYLLAKAVKRVVERDRPGAFLDGVSELEDFGTGSLGYPSGHAVVAATITTVCFAHLPGRWRLAAVLVTLAVLFGRVYNGGHLPLDVVGGAALGVTLGTFATLVLRDDEHDDRRLGHAPPR